MPADQTCVAKVGDRVRIEWEDIQDFSDEDWNGDVDVIDTATLTTQGIVIESFYNSSRCLKIARDHSISESTYHGCRAIPAGAVTCVLNYSTDEEWEQGGGYFKVVGESIYPSTGDSTV